VSREQRGEVLALEFLKEVRPGDLVGQLERGLTLARYGGMEPRRIVPRAPGSIHQSQQTWKW